MHRAAIVVGLAALLAVAPKTFAATPIAPAPSEPAFAIDTGQAEAAVMPVRRYYRGYPARGYYYGYPAYGYPRYYTYRPYGYYDPGYYGPAWGPQYDYYPYGYRYRGPRAYIGIGF